MAQESGTFDTYTAVGNKEDLEDLIYNLSPTECPLMAAIGRGKAKGVKHEWQIDALADAVDSNQKFEGDVAAFSEATPTTRICNYTQISDKTAMVTGTQEVVDKAGRRSEMGYQMMLRSKELKRDLEKQMCSNKASEAGDASTQKRQSAGLRAWIATNDDLGGGAAASGGYSAGIVAAATDGDQRAFLESDLKSVIANVWDAGGDPTMILVSAFNKQVMSGFTGNATRTDRSEDKKLTASIDVYVSDFGDHKVVPSRFSVARNAYVLTPRLWKVAYLRSFRQHKIAKTGDNEKRQILVEYCLVSKNEAGSGCVADLTTS